MDGNIVSTTDGATNYAAIRAQGRDALRRAILDAATRLLVGEGPAALGLRRIAREVGCSTTVLYTLFGGKPGLVEALWREGFQRLWQVEVAAAAGAAPDPAARLAALGQAYWTHALENPDYYRVMFGGAMPGFQPSANALALSRRTFEVVVDAVRAGVAAGLLRSDDPELMAAAFWATSHGVVSLYLNGQFGAVEAKAIYDRALAALATGFGSPPSRTSRR